MTKDKEDAGTCGCPGSDTSAFQNKERDECAQKVEKKKPKDPCGPSKLLKDEGKGKCHDSQEQFKKNRDKCESAKDEDKCHNSREVFMKEVAETCSSSCGGKGKDCHESHKQFFKKEDARTCESSSKPVIDPCRDKAKKKGDVCEDKHKDFFKTKENSESSFNAMFDPCEKKSKDKCEDKSKSFFKKKEGSEKCATSLEAISDPCKKKSQDVCEDKSNAFFKKKEGADQEKCSTSRDVFAKNKKGPLTIPLKSISQSREAPCATAPTTAKGDSTYTKISKYCKDFAKQYVKLKPKSKCTGVSDAFEESCGKPFDLPKSQPPCNPMAERGMKAAAAPPCSPSVTCPHVKKTSAADFFPLDARNKKLNECIDKYMKIDPSQVISKCSRFAKETSGVSQECVESVKKAQQKCLPTGLPPQTKGVSYLVPPKGRQLAGRWAPSAGFYLATTALLTVYLTEWKAVLRHVPFYSNVVKEDADLS